VGCSDDDREPHVDPTPSTSTTTTTSPTPDPTPTVAPLGPVETVKAWVQARNLAMSDGDVAPVRALSAPECQSCSDLIDPIEKTYERGGHYETKGWRVVRTKVTSEDAAKVEVVAGLELGGGRTFHSPTADPVVYPSEKRIGIFELTRSNDQWRIALIGFAR
ncbi:DUF6318 family protein, partial [Nocardioides szechwanensis]